MDNAEKIAARKIAMKKYRIMAKKSAEITKTIKRSTTLLAVNLFIVIPVLLIVCFSYAAIPAS